MLILLIFCKLQSNFTFKQIILTASILKQKLFPRRKMIIQDPMHSHEAFTICLSGDWPLLYLPINQLKNLSRWSSDLGFDD